MFTSRPPDPSGKAVDHVQGGGSFPRAVWMARTIVEAGSPVNSRYHRRLQGSPHLLHCTTLPADDSRQPAWR